MQTPHVFTDAELLKLANQHLATPVDADLHGKPITDYDALIHGAFGPAVVRIINLAITQYAGKLSQPLSHEQLLEVAPAAIAQAVDYNFAKPPQLITHYGILLEDSPMNYSSRLLALTNLALQAVQDRSE